MAVLVLGAGGFYAFQKFTALPPPPPKKPVAKKPVVPPHEEPPPSQATTPETPPAAEKPKEEPPVSGTETATATQSAAKPAETTASAAQTAPAATAPATPAPPPPPPAPSMQFKAWVLGLQIRGVRGGSNPRVFIERTAYGPGDVVNPQLGIVFVGYNSATRMLIFQDKRTGAIFERQP